MLYSPGHDFGMVLFGTSDTSNALADQFKGQYENVTTCRTLAKIDLDFFRDMDEYTAELDPQKSGDIMDGMIVALDMLNRFCGTKKYRKRIFLITDGERATKTSKSELDSLKQQMNQNNVRLNVITLDFGNELGQDDEEDEEEQAQNGKSSALNSKSKQKNAETKAQSENKKLLVDITESVKGAVFPANIAMQIYQQFKKREVTSRARFRGNLDLSKDLQVGVQIYTRTREEAFPTLKKYSKNVEFNPNPESGKVEL